MSNFKPELAEGQTVVMFKLADGASPLRMDFGGFDSSEAARTDDSVKFR